WDEPRGRTVPGPAKSGSLRREPSPGVHCGSDRRYRRRSRVSRPLDLHRIDAHFLVRTVGMTPRHFGDEFHDVVSLDHLAENTMLVIEPRCGGHRDKELTAVRIGSGVRHRKKARLAVLQRRMKFVRETVTGTAASGAFRIASLDHEIGNYAMEDGAVVKRLP